MLPQSVSPDPGSITFFQFAGSLFKIFKQDPSKFGGLFCVLSKLDHLEFNKFSK